jgi:hypothetical protein
MQCVGRRRTRSPNSPKSDRIRDDTTASPTVEHKAVLDADDPTDRLQPGCQPLRSTGYAQLFECLWGDPRAMRPAEDAARDPVR